MTDAIETTNGRLRVVFTRQGDRYSHEIQSVDGASVTTLLASIEGTDEQIWPPSPPFQQLSIQELPDGRRAAMLVGMAGRNHWSASVEPVGDSFVFDVACRIHEEAGELPGSSYQAFAGNSLEPNDNETRVSETDGLVKATPLASERSKRMETQRWKYRFRQ